MVKEIAASYKLARYLAVVLGIALGYFLFARLGLLLALPDGIATPVWPASGFAWASIILFGYRVWPGIVLGSVLGQNWIFTSAFFDFLPLNLAIGFGASLQALVAAYLLNRLAITPNIFKSYKFVYLFFLVTFLSCLINSTLAVLLLFAAGVLDERIVIQNWLTWWLGDSAGIFIITPLILAWSHPPTWKQFLSRVFEAIQLFVVILFVTFLCFGWWFQKGYPLEYLLIPCLLWAILRFGMHGATVALTLIAALAILGTAKGFGPFVQPSLNTSLLLLQVFIGVIAAMTLTLIAVLNELKQANDLLKSYSWGLESQVNHRTALVQERTLELQDIVI